VRVEKEGGYAWNMLEPRVEIRRRVDIEK